MSVDGATVPGCILTCAALCLLSRKWCLPHGASVLIILCSGIGGLLAGNLLLMSGLERLLALAIGVAAQIVVFVGLLLWRFYRDPERTCAENPRGILAPADGQIIYIKRVEDAPRSRGEKGGHEDPYDELAQVLADEGAAWLIGTSMSFTDVHVNRAPIEGTIKLSRHVPGRFLSLRVPEARSVNERASTVISNGSLHVAVIQIASRIVRQIVCYFDVGETVKQGQRIGMIRFGSQVDLVIPIHGEMKVLVEVGDRVIGGETVVCSWDGTNG
jgi:phosphatidylserine decarboxylase